MVLVDPSCGVALIVAIGSDIIIVYDFSTVFFSLSSTESETLYSPFVVNFSLKLPGAPFHPFSYMLSCEPFVTFHRCFMICLPPSGVVADQSILKPSLASAAVNLIGNSSFNLFPFVTTTRFAACGPTLMFVVASPSNTHLSSLWALLTVRRMT